MRQLRGRTSGFAIPDYVLDTPYGKVPLNRSYVRGRAADHVVMESYGGQLWAEPNPIPDDVEVPFRLPEIEMPDEADTIETEETEPLAAAHTDASGMATVESGASCSPSAPR
jgi:lysine 2,3-aminomutase